MANTQYALTLTDTLFVRLVEMNETLRTTRHPAATAAQKTLNIAKAATVGKTVPAHVAALRTQWGDVARICNDSKLPRLRQQCRDLGGLIAALGKRLAAQPVAKPVMSAPQVNDKPRDLLAEAHAIKATAAEVAASMELDGAMAAGEM